MEGQILELEFLWSKFNILKHLEEEQCPTYDVQYVQPGL